MTNYQELYNSRMEGRDIERSEAYLKNIGLSEAPIEWMDSAEKSELMEIYDWMRDMIYRDHQYLYYAKVPWVKVDRIYKECFKEIAKSERLDYNQLAGYFYKELSHQ